MILGDALEADVAAGHVGARARRMRFAGDWVSAVAIVAACVGPPSVLVSAFNIWLPSDLHAVYQSVSEIAALVVGVVLARSVMTVSEPRWPQAAVATLVATLGIGAAAFAGPHYQIEGVRVLSSALNGAYAVLGAAGILGVPAAILGCVVLMFRSHGSTWPGKVGAALVVLSLASVIAYSFYVDRLGDHLLGDINGFESELIWAEGLEAAEAPAGAAVIAAIGLMGSARRRTRIGDGRSA